LIALFVLCRIAEASDPDPRRVFLERYEPHAAKLGSRYTKIKFKERTRSNQGPAQEQVMTVSGSFDFEHYRLHSSDDAIIDRTTKTERKLGTQIEVRNSKYHFTLQDKGQGQYLLLNSTVFSDGPPMPRCSMCFPFAVAYWGRTYLDVARDPDTKIFSARETVWRKQEVFEVRLECSFYHRGKNRHDRATFAWYFAPKSGWVYVGGHGIDFDPAKPRFERVYTYDTSGEWAVPVREEVWEIYERQPEKNNRLSVSEILEFAPDPDWDEAKCRLTAFGLPEPAGVVWPRRTPRYVWFLVAAAGFALVASGFWWLARRRGKATREVV
jgi:hypothetical protein